MRFRQARPRGPQPFLTENTRRSKARRGGASIAVRERFGSGSGTVRERFNGVRLESPPVFKLDKNQAIAPGRAVPYAVIR